MKKELRAQCGPDLGPRVFRQVIDSSWPKCCRVQLMCRRKRPQPRWFLREFHCAQRVDPCADFGDEAGERRLVGKLPRTAQCQMYRRPPLQLTVGRLNIAGFMRTRRINRAGLLPEVSAERQILDVEAALTAAKRWHQHRRPDCCHRRPS